MRALPRFNFILFVGLAFCSARGQNQQVSLEIKQVQSDSLFQSVQQIHILSLQGPWQKNYSVGFFQPELGLAKTSEMGLAKSALAAINGSFFDIKAGNGVVYLESEGKPLSNSITGGIDFLQNGVVLITRSGEVHIGNAKPDLFYQNSTEEAFVLVSGPVLLKNGVAEPLQNHPFVTKRHPRTCICETISALKFIVVDGRSETADGMSLSELQEFLLSLDCKDALNLDGGGSSTLWSAEKGILNHPSDKNGERPVSSTILVFEN